MEAVGDGGGGWRARNAGTKRKKRRMTKGRTDKM